MKFSKDNTKKRLVQQILSVFIAIILWIIIINTENPSINTTLSSVSVTLKGEEKLTDQDLMVVNKHTIPGASAVIKGKRADLINVMGNITAGIDLSDITSAGEYKLRPTFEIPSNSVSVTKINTPEISVTVEPMKQKTLHVEIKQKNAEKNKAYIVESLSDITKVEIKGESGDIDTIDHASVYVDVGTMTRNTLSQYRLVFEDENNSEVIPVNSIYCDTETISVKNNVYDIITLNVDVQLPSLIDNRYSVKLIDCETETVKAGIKSDAARTTTTVTASALLIEPVPGTQKYTLMLTVPPGIYIPKEEQSITVELEVFEPVEKFVSVPLTVKNTKQRQYTLKTENVSILISGPEEKLKSENLICETDIDEIINPGDYQLPVKVTSKEKDITIKSNETSINITIR